MRGVFLKISCFIAIFLILSGCSSIFTYGNGYNQNQYEQQGPTSYNNIEYDISLSEVQRPAKATERYGKQTIEKVVENGISKYYFEDKMLKITWLPIVSQLSFVINNKTDFSIRVIWDEAAYVDENGLSLKIVHSGIKYADRSNSHPPSVVVRKGSLADSIVPVDYISWHEGYYAGDWETKPLFPTKEQSYSSTPNQILKQFAGKYLNKTFQVLLPLQIEDVTNDYIFTFKINDIVINGKRASSKSNIEPEENASSSQASIGLALVGINWSDDPDAMIEDTATRKTYFLKTGQMIEGYRIERVNPTSVIVRKGNSIFELK